MKRFLPVLMGFALLLLSSTEGWSLPPCPGSYNYRTWTDCEGTYTTASGTKYVGQWKDNKPHGQGTTTTASRTKYVGQWKNGKRHGQGKLIYADGRVKEGIWEYGALKSAQKSPTKRGSFPPCDHDSHPSTWTYCEGTYTWVSGYKKANVGKMSHGDKYVGEWKDGKLHGKGTYTYPLWSGMHAGGNYVGEFIDNLRHGRGTQTYANGDKYVGEWKDGNRHGQGTETYASGTKYVGQWKSGNQHGQGTLTYADGEKYVGGFRDGLHHGNGTITYSNGKTLKGIWENDKFKSARD